jgi:hypothetical protein
MILVRLLLPALLLLTIACDLPDRVSRLEKKSEELDTRVSKNETTADYDLQAKCSKDARAWFNENWSRDKDTVLLDFSNHYNKKGNKCFIFVEYHYNNRFVGQGGTGWTNHMSLWDIYENSKYGEFVENHYTYFKPTITTSDQLVTCDMFDQKCKSMDEFNSFMRPYLND